MTFLRCAALLLVAAATATAGGSACSGNGSLAGPAPCATPAATPTVPRSTNPDFYRARTYRLAVDGSVQEINRLTDEFLGAYPSRKLGSSREFRTAAVAFIDQVTCTAKALGGLSPPVEFYAEFNAALGAAMDDLVETMALGREAVRQRNVTRYREFNTRLDGNAEMVRKAMDQLPRPGGPGR